MSTIEPASDRLLRPEVELRTQICGNEWHYPSKELITSLDLLELYPDGKSVVKKGMGESEFAQYCESNDFKEADGPCLRVFFVEELYLPQPTQEVLDDKSTMRMAGPPEDYKDKTAIFMHEHFQVPMSFFLQQDHYVTQVSTGSSTFFQRNEAGNRVSMDGYYQFCSEYQTDKPGYTWFSQSLELRKRASVYVIFKAPAVSKMLLLECARGTNWRRLTLPFAIDTFLMNDCIMQMSSQVSEQRTEFLDIEGTVIGSEGRLPNFSVSDNNLKALYLAAREFQCYNDNLDCVNTTLDFLLAALDRFATAGHPFADPDLESIQSSLLLLKTKVVWMAREVSSLKNRANLRITLESSIMAGAKNWESRNAIDDTPDNTNIARQDTPTATANQSLEKNTGEEDSSSTVAPSAESMKFERAKPWRKWLRLPAFIRKISVSRN